jgi:hypothetical protein
MLLAVSRISLSGWGVGTKSPQPATGAASPVPLSGVPGSAGDRRPALRRLSAALVWVLLALLAFVLVEAVFEAWVQVLLAKRGGIDSSGNRIVSLPTWPKTLKNLAFLALLAATAAKILLDRRWREFATAADLTLVVLGVVLVLAGVVGNDPPTLIAQAAYVYLRGAIVFYAWRAADPRWRQIRAVLAIMAGIVAVNALIAIVQTVVGYDSYRALGWVNLSWARINRAQALLDHPNNLGHLLGLALLGLLAWFVTRPKVGWRWWIGFGALALGMSASQSRESLIGFIFGAVVIALLRRGGWRTGKVVAIALALVVGFAVVQVGFSPANRAELQRRLAGVFSAFKVQSGQEGDNYCVTGNAGCTADSNQIPQREVRVLYAQQGVKLWLHRPLLGYGVGQFGGIVAFEHDPLWYQDTRFGPHGFDMHGFNGNRQVDSFWLHLVVETGSLGVLTYLAWLGLLIAPFTLLARRRKRGPGRPDTPLHPFAYWAPAAVVFGAEIAIFATSLEDPIFPALMFTILGIGWVLLRRGELAPPPVASDPPVPGQHQHRYQSLDHQQLSAEVPFPYPPTSPEATPKRIQP